jgi:hypothetical protein
MNVHLWMLKYEPSSHTPCRNEENPIFFVANVCIFSKITTVNSFGRGFIGISSVEKIRLSCIN